MKQIFKINLNMFTDRQLRLIDTAKKLGYGYAIFAGNVSNQGFCSAKQEKALANMVSAGEYRKNNWKPANGKKKPLTHKHNLTDCEIMQAGLYL